MSENDSGQYSWCSFQARQDQSIILEYIVLASQIAIFALMIYAYVRAKRQNRVNQLSAVYKLIIAWLICFFLKTLINIVAYFEYMDSSPLNQQHSGQNQEPQIDFLGLRIMSSIFLFLDVVTTFALQITMIYIPYLWMKNALELLPDQNFDVDERKRIYRISWLLRLVKKYMILRNLYLLYFLTVSITLMMSNGFENYDKYITIASLIDSLVILALNVMGFLTFGLIKDKIALSKKQAKSIIIEYIILLCCNAIRIVLNSFFYFSDVIDYQPDKYCFDDHSSEETLINCLYLAFGLSLMHILPGSMILYVYWPSDKDKTDLKGSLLISASQQRFY